MPPTRRCIGTCPKDQDGCTDGCIRRKYAPCPECNVRATDACVTCPDRRDMPPSALFDLINTHNLVRRLREAGVVVDDVLRDDLARLCWDAHTKGLRLDISLIRPRTR